MKQLIVLFFISLSLYAQDCEHIKPAEVEYLGIQTAETVQNDSLNCIIFTRQAERFICPVCKLEVLQESRKDTVIFWSKEEAEWLKKAKEDLEELERLKNEGL